ncbi:type I restriction enzyme HsdR N-terminal domain-containing protein [Robiginitalea sediminis]|uniref:type I restriction enzyme HsdR N-terminal domain-containing protein n=1 Tax=Robiginitalea sediminis TaxID=1982593 RepID=UPI000B4ACE47|nr:type I restriction enzyme HsdR N-terminal domain-containing protein [Robiginitalea sediminis]
MASIQQISKELNKTLTSFELEKAIELSDNEAKTRMYLTEPFFEALRFNRGFESGNLVPEYDADFANLKGKKVDYAILLRNKPEIIVEVKKASTKLTDKHLAQLNEYFVNTNESKIGVLTNGIEYKFYCRNNNAGYGLHPTPFYEFDWQKVDGSSLEQLANFYATIIDTKSIIEKAQDLFFMEGFEDALYNELAHPSRDLVKSIYSRMGGSRLTDSIEKQIRELINSISIRSALDRLIVEESSKANSGIITTQDELKYYHIIKTILAQHRQIDTDSIGYRDLKGKFSILIDNNQLKKICDLYITPNSQRIEIDGEKIDIPDIDSVVKLKKRLIDRTLELLK